MAITLHGGSYLTSDCDVVFEKTQENLDHLKEALESLEARPLRAPDEGHYTLDNSLLLQPFLHLKSDAGPVDLINRLPEVLSFEDLYSRAVAIEIDGVQIPIASLDDLIQIKSSSDRPRDRLHVEMLNALKSLRDES